MKASSTDKGLFGRYRALMITIAVFLISDVAVVSLTLYFAKESRAYATELEAARKVRELTLELQRQASEMFILSLRNFEIPREFVEEIVVTTDTYRDTLNALDVGGELTTTDGATIQVRALSEPSSRESRTVVDDQFLAIETAVGDLEQIDTPKGSDMSYLYAYTNRFYFRSFGEIDNLLNKTRELATSASFRLRTTQVVGLIVALTNFLYTAFISVRALLRNDRQLNAARRETDEILANVGEGLLLLDADLRIGTTTSAALPDILQRTVEPGTPLPELLESMLSPESLEAAVSYLNLLVKGRVKESLVRSLNPLSEVEIRHAAGGSRQSRYLSFQFARVQNERGEFSHLLVTIQDATRRVQLSNELQEARNRTRSELEVYLRLLSKDPSALQRFIDDTRGTVDAINARMQAAADRGGADYPKMVRLMFQDVHAIKGDALGLNLDFFAESAHRFEEDLQSIRKRPDLNGQDLVGLAVRLDDFYQRLEVLSSIVDRLSSSAPPGALSPQAPQDAFDALAEQLTEVASQTAARIGKQVRVLCDLHALKAHAPAHLAEIREILIQLVRNAVVHGVESPAERLAARKREIGTITVCACESPAGTLDLSVRDDGRGIDARRIRTRLIDSGRHTAEELQQLEDRQIVAKIFEPGFSSTTEVDQDSGRGVGLDLVRERASALGGRVRLSSQPLHYTDIGVALPASATAQLASVTL